MNEMKDMLQRGLVWCALVALMLVGMAEALPTGGGSQWLPQPRSGDGIEVVIVCDSGRGYPVQTYTPPGIHGLTFGQMRPWTMVLPQVSRSHRSLPPILSAGFDGAPLIKSQLRLSPAMSRGCRPVISRSESNG
jgi:hypothetical protein